MSVSILLLTCILATCIALVLYGKTLLGKIYLHCSSPPKDLLTILSTNKVIELGIKNGPIRKELILSSANPSVFSTYENPNQIIIPSNVMVSKDYGKRKLFGFFHPYCNAGGGGEKVLWKAVESTLADDAKNVVVLYTGDRDSSPNEILASVIKSFDYKLDEKRIVFIYLKYRYLVDSKTWPHFTLLGQAIGSMLLTLEAILQCPCDIWCDTMGYPFGYPIASILLKVPIVTYTHYPVISTDMFNKLSVSIKSPLDIKTRLKYCYWKLFMFWYQNVGSYVTIATTNSTWTSNHISQIWTNIKNHILYPPCSTEKLIIQNKTWDRKNQAVVIAQFRPEKRHQLIIKSYGKIYHRLLVEDESKLKNYPILILIGSTRSQADRDYVKSLQDLAYHELKVPQNRIIFHTDCSYTEMKRYLQESSYGINAMWNEHFGIAVVEYVASGLIPLVHASAGPLLDIVVPWDKSNHCQANITSDETRTGYFFKSIEDPDYYDSQKEKSKTDYPSLDEILLNTCELDNKSKYEISERGKECALEKFSDEKFNINWKKYVLDAL
ncbi:hypothetical protein TBLA_0B05860 [Henningerozyma blattae CBS 6284]|uniref:GDP-Man:Man(3)GlcNAc(2)-PP-Dol alpha-1,2-mannosyltransferase n=1 Tax=Henningerozyma blattae (strain ATCC 34711 / CBS 6284 / DSM 70876 / NBRC 10599 / NRRL Y-10934 / UCD 77-7) TaxID=1071380 RepID=I2GZ60_HENB6|nr:hypothetical protein TBLA_0B05860 [Tetrapisispora blattae CBS 6284]CCH59412.1 hypothetical protein TBLA_0B05860 [Tetrapisispora blattae CBS 6284]